jgi:hypothetical protein
MFVLFYSLTKLYNIIYHYLVFYYLSIFIIIILSENYGRYHIFIELFISKIMGFLLDLSWGLV